MKLFYFSLVTVFLCSATNLKANAQAEEAHPAANEAHPAKDAHPVEAHPAVADAPKDHPVPKAPEAHPAVEAEAPKNTKAHEVAEKPAAHDPIENVPKKKKAKTASKDKTPKVKPNRDLIFKEEKPVQIVLDTDPKMEAPRSTIEDLQTLAPPQPPKHINRKLASGDNTADLQYYKDLDRKLGVNLGMMMPFGDFQTDFSMAPALGLHYTWSAMAPFSFSLSTLRASVHHKNGPAAGKLTVNSIAFGTIGSFPTGRFIPFVKLEGSFNFNDVSFDATRVFVSGHDTFVTTVGVNFGIGWDFVVGREFSLGLDATYHYSIPKKALLSNGDQYDLGSSYATATFRLNF